MTYHTETCANDLTHLWRFFVHLILPLRLIELYRELGRNSGYDGIILYRQAWWQPLKWNLPAQVAHHAASRNEVNQLKVSTLKRIKIMRINSARKPSVWTFFPNWLTDLPHRLFQAVLSMLAHLRRVGGCQRHNLSSRISITGFSTRWPLRHETNSNNVANVGQKLSFGSWGITSTARNAGEQLCQRHFQPSRLYKQANVMTEQHSQERFTRTSEQIPNLDRRRHRRSIHFAEWNRSLPISSSPFLHIYRAR